MGMPGQPEILAAATDANHFRPLEAVEDAGRVHFASEYIDGQVGIPCFSPTSTCRCGFS